MSSDNTELTFVRCSSCRTLIPALSTRCKMCGATLEHEESAAEAVASTANGADVEDNLENDPLSDYMDELDETVEDSEDAIEEDSDSEDDDTDSAIEELDALLEELKAMEDEADSTEEAPAAKVKPVAPKAKSVIRETGGRKSKESKLSFSNKKETSAKKEAPVEKKAVSKKEEAVRKEAPARSSGRRSASKSKTNVTDIKSASVKQETSESSLFGWFISYDNDQGNSFEIREGKFFVSKSSLKKTDLIIEDESVSTPHALVTVNSEIGFQIQDLMSEEGVFVKRAGEADFDIIEDIEVIESGDWIRFGNVEYLVVFVNG